MHQHYFTVEPDSELFAAMQQEFIEMKKYIERPHLAKCQTFGDYALNLKAFVGQSNKFKHAWPTVLFSETAILVTVPEQAAYNPLDGMREITLTEYRAISNIINQQ